MGLNYREKKMIKFILFVIWIIGVFKVIGLAIDPVNPPVKFSDFIVIGIIGVVWPLIFIVSLIQCCAEEIGKNK